MKIKNKNTIVEVLNKTKIFIKNNPKMLGILGISIILPVLLTLFFYYGNVNLATINILSPQKTSETATETTTQNRLKLKLISENEFLDKFNPAPAFLPKPIQINTTLSGFLKSNSALDLLPTRNWAVPFKDVEAYSAIAIEMPTKRILYGKNVYQVRPIASITKLVTAVVAFENIDPDTIVTISQDAIETEGAAGGLVGGEKLTAEELAYALLLESSNDAAIALAEHYNDNREEGAPDFVELMNIKVQNWGINDTSFEEPTGLSANNTSSANSIGKILYEATQNKDIAYIMRQTSHATEALNKDMAHYWINLNTLLGAYPEIIGGKTGFTDEAGPSMAIIATTPNSDRYVVIAVLNAIDRVAETRELYNWVKEAYIWEE